MSEVGEGFHALGTEGSVKLLDLREASAMLWSARGTESLQTCMGLFLSSSHFGLVGGSLFVAGMPFFVPSPAIRFAERAEGVKGPKRLAKLGGLPLSGACVSQRPLFKPGAGFEA